MMDLDGLKQINDQHGHQLGSHCIAEAGKIIKVCLPDGAAGARFGGDEFVVWFADCGLEAAVQVAETIRVRIEGFEFRLESVVVAPTISIGLAALDADVRQPEDLTREADAALYRAKQAGRNAVSR
jgi:diguanylate cyclase (GGDEF)-like protein